VHQYNSEDVASAGKIHCSLQQEQMRSDHLIRMHLIGEPSAPTSLRGKQCNMYSPFLTLSSLRASTMMIS
jgi:hypothetical protein